MAETTEKLLVRVLEDPGLVQAVRELEPAHLVRLVDAVGIADAGELLAMATPEQFVHLIDTSLWTADDGQERFDHLRFVTWLEVMFEGGDELVARRLAELPEETLVLAFFGQLLVLDSQTLGVGMAGSSDHHAELTEKALDACLYLELGNYTLVARQSVGWDSVIAAVLALDRYQHGLFERVLEDCCRASTDFVEDEGGLYEVLSGDEMIAEDALAERVDRRATRGFVSVADATAFARLAEQTAPSEQPPERDPITRAYFRELDETAARVQTGSASNLVDLLREHGVLRDGRPALESPASRRFRDALQQLPEQIAERRRAELAYVANVLVAIGHEPVDAAQLAIETCAAGLERVDGPTADPLPILREHGCDQLFRLGWATNAP